MLFDNDYTFLSFVNTNDENVNSPKLCESTAGFVKGNMFECEYSEYKHYKPRMPKTTCERSAKLYRIMELNFVITDLNLWLDLHPDDEKVFAAFKEYCALLCKHEADFIKKYGPIELAQNVFDKNQWVKGPMPWEKEDSIYV